MAIIQCSECSGDVSTKAASCPHCGAPVEAAPVEMESEKLTLPEFAHTEVEAPRVQESDDEAEEEIDLEIELAELIGMTESQRREREKELSEYVSAEAASVASYELRTIVSRYQNEFATGGASLPMRALAWVSGWLMIVIIIPLSAAVCGFAGGVIAESVRPTLDMWGLVAGIGIGLIVGGIVVAVILSLIENAWAPRYTKRCREVIDEQMETMFPSGTTKRLALIKMLSEHRILSDPRTAEEKGMLTVKVCWFQEKYR